MLNNKTILLVDDSYALKLLSKMLLRSQYPEIRIDDVADGLAALEYLGIPENNPDVILLDMNMPKMDGYEFLLEYKKRGMHNSDTKIYMLTTITHEENRNKIMATGIVNDYFEKPLTERHIGKIVKDLLVVK